MVPFRETAREVADHSPGIRIGTVSFQTPDGTELSRRYLHTPDTVAVVAVLDGGLLLVREFRAAVGSDVLQVPMGKVDGGREPIDCAYSELAEETGYRAGRCEPVGSLLSCPGWMNQVLHVFRAYDLVALPQRPDSGDDIEEAMLEIEHLPLAEYDTALRSGRIRDARTIAAVRLALG